MRFKPAIRLLLVCGATALLATACGGSGGSAQRLSRVDFITKANEICRALSAQEHAKPSASNDPRTAFDNNLRYLNDALGKLDKLKPPTESEAKFSDMKKQLHSMVAFLKENRLYLVALTVHLQQHPEDTKALHQFERKIKLFDRNAANAKRDSDLLTLNACSAGLGPAGG